MSILITGAAGFIGSHLSRLFISMGMKVIGVDNYSLGSDNHIVDLLSNEKFSIYKIDLSDIKAYRELFSKITSHTTISEVWHLAANSDIFAGVKDSSLDFSNTFLTTYNTVQIMKEFQIRVICFASTSAIYGDHGDVELHENIGPLLPVSNYGAMKLASEAVISAATESFLDKAFIFRFPNVVGSPATHGVILDFIRKLTADRNVLNVLGDGKQQKGYLHVSDLIDAMCFVRNNSTNKLTYINIGSNDHGVSVENIARQVVERVNPSASIKFGSSQKGWVGDVPRFRFSVRKLNSLGWRPKLDSFGAICLAIDEVLKQDLN
jgi:UDP-glucose 4-epimerase